jgi:hypothetical protein
MKNEQICGTFKLGLKFMPIEECIGCINQSEVLQKKTVNSSLKPVKYLTFNI